MDKTKQILLTEIRKLRSKAWKKKREADRLEEEANKLEEKVNGMA